MLCIRTYGDPLVQAERVRERVGRSAWLSAAFALLLAFVAPNLLRAQATGEITGRISDPSGAVVPNAKVTATRVETGVSQSTVTSSSGTYTIPSLLVGTYKVTASAQGFKMAGVEDITLDVSQQRQVNFTLALAGVKVSVEVNAAPPLINVTNGTLAQVVSGEQVQNLPLNGRNIEGLMTMEPGVVPSTGSMGWMSNELVGNGNRGETEVGTLDGADTSDAEMGTLQFTNFNLDAIAEFKVQSNDYSAQYGQGAGTITQIVSKSGTNQFHGSLFDFVRNSTFDARNFFATTVPPFKRNEFGGTFGGPIKKDKTFFFLEYAGLRQRLGEPNFAVVPTAAERNGAVTVTDANGNPDQLQVPLNPVAAQVLSKYPMPNQPGGIDGANTFNYELSQPTNDDQFSARLDQHFSGRDTLFARASYDNHILRDTDAFAAEIDGSNFSSSNLGEARNYAIGETHIFTPTLVSDFMFTLNRGIEGVPETPAEFNTTDTSFSDGSLQNWGPDSFETKYVTTVFDPLENLEWTKGRHSFTFGGEYRREWDNGTGVTGTGPSGSYSFNPGTPLPVAIPSTNGDVSLAAGASSPSGLVSMMEGSDYQYERATTAPGFGPAGAGGGGVWWGLRRWTAALYAQDDFKATRRLTLNFGLRYEYASVPWEVDNRLAGPADYGNLYGRFVVNPQPLWQPDYLYGDFGPRFGLAVDLGHNTVLRGGFGAFTNVIPTVYPDQALVNFPLASENYQLNAPYSLTPTPVSLPVMTSITGQPIAANGNTKTIPPNTPVNIAPYAAILGPLYVDDPSDRMRNGYTINGNFTLEHEFPAGIAVSASYVLNNGVDDYNSAYPNAYSGAEPQYTPYTNITPGVGEIQVFYNGGYSYYNALQVQARKISPTHGLQFQANYTWAKDMTDADSVWNTGATNPQDPNCIKCEYSPAAYNVSQRFVANFEYDLPLGNWQALSRIPQRLTRGWEFLGIYQIQTGYPFTVGSPYGTLQYGEGGNDRPFLIEQPTLSPTEGGGPQFFSNAVIGSNNGSGTGFFNLPTVVSPVNGVQVMPGPGNLGRDTFTGPRWSNFDFSVVKNTQITESMRLQFRAEFFNIFNLATFSTPGAGGVAQNSFGGGQTLGSPGFGFSSSTPTNEREIQFGLRFIF
ncbi:MAG TPA: carboxypeptidase regulatory-like domain-containing protein [Terriglobia bacterium]|nr:carboxypeptidase regulatory-like domain-containing protein [Terriglobia bacterium]